MSVFVTYMSECICTVCVNTYMYPCIKNMCSMYTSIYQGVQGLENYQHLSIYLFFSCLKDEVNWISCKFENILF